MQSFRTGVMAMEIKRSKYLNELLSRRQNGMIKIITGIRRCGKSYLLFNIFKKQLLSEGVDSAHIIEIVLDNVEFEPLCDIHELYKYVKRRITDSGQYYLLLDEVQYAANFEYALNSFLHIDNIDVYVTGSNSKFLSSDIVTEFRGRGDEIRVFPLSFKEFYDFKGGSYETAWNEYMIYGGMPALVQIDSDVKKRRYLHSLFNNVYINDVVDRHKIRIKDDLDDIMNVLASSTGSVTNANKIANTLRSVKGSSCTYDTVARYIEYLEDAFLISSARRYDINGRHYINAGMKYYFVDNGLRNARLNFRNQDASHLMENVICNELLMRGFSIDVGVVEKSAKNMTGSCTRQQFEVDFVANEFDSRYYIQSVWEMLTDAKKKQETQSLERINDAFRKIIIVQGNFLPWTDENGYRILSLKDFLLNENSLKD